MAELRAERSWTSKRGHPLLAGVNRPSVVSAAIVAFVISILAADRVVGQGDQLFLGLAMWLGFLVALRPLSLERRLQAGIVVCVASLAEVVGSLLWGVYAYRHGNLPLFVPPGHGLVYLAGWRLSETRLGRDHERAFVRAVAAAAIAWAALGLASVPRLDASGALGTAVFLFFLLRGRAAAVYAGVFCVVASVELSGTALGTWQWAEVVPGLLLPSGNPPSGAASGYVLFDVIAIAGAAWLIRRRSGSALRSHDDFHRSCRRPPRPAAGSARRRLV